MDWIDLAQDRDQWSAIVDRIMKLRVPLNVGKFLSSWWLLNKVAAPWSQLVKSIDLNVGDKRAGLSYSMTFFHSNN
jgi:hypothetical protein